MRLRVRLLLVGKRAKRRKKKIDGQKRVAPLKAVTNLRPLFGEPESPPEG